MNQMNKYIFVINGSGGVGKDTFVNMVAKYAQTINFSSVDKVKEVAKLLGWKGGKTGYGCKTKGGFGGNAAIRCDLHTSRFHFGKKERILI